MTKDVQFEFMGFKPDEQIKTFVSSVVDQLHFSAPSDAALKLVIKKSKDMIRASCRIASQAGTFVADTMSDNPIRAVQQIENKIRRQLDHWKKIRFEKTAQDFFDDKDAR
jgi:ribosome-associated translation inhibitor RaiA